MGAVLFSGLRYGSRVIRSMNVAARFATAERIENILYRGGATLSRCGTTAAGVLLPQLDFVDIHHHLDRSRRLHRCHRGGYRRRRGGHRRHCPSYACGTAGDPVDDRRAGKASKKAGVRTIGCATNDFADGDNRWEPPISAVPPSKPEIFHGREERVALLVALVVGDQPARIALTGAGGIGKTTVALAVIHDDIVYERFQDRRFFVLVRGRHRCAGCGEVSRAHPVSRSLSRPAQRRRTAPQLSFARAHCD